MLHLGKWESVLADVEVDAVICDPPFGARTHAAWREGPRTAGRPGDRTRGGAGYMAAALDRTPITYESWTAEHVHEFVKSWHSRTRGWMVALTSHDLAPAWQDAYEEVGRYSFAPLPCVTWGGSVRLAGDGPSSWTVWAMVARPRTETMHKWGTLPGAYQVTTSIDDRRANSGGGRGKPLDLMRALVTDYSRPGDLVCDPVAGYGSTLAAALQKGRRAIGAEVDPAVHAEALRRLARVQTVDLFAEPKRRQAGLL